MLILLVRVLVSSARNIHVYCRSTITINMNSTINITNMNHIDSVCDTNRTGKIASTGKFKSNSKSNGACNIKITIMSKSNSNHASKIKSASLISRKMNRNMCRMIMNMNISNDCTSNSNITSTSNNTSTINNNMKINCNRNS